MKKSIIYTYLSAALFLLLFIGTSSCKKAEKHISPATEQPTGTETSTNDGIATLATDDGQGTISDSQSWPAEAPTEVPVFTYGDIKSTISGHTPTGNTWAVTYMHVSPEALKKYEADLKEAGFTTSAAIQNGREGSLLGEKAGLTVSLMMGEGNAVIGINQPQG